MFYSPYTFPDTVRIKLPAADKENAANSITLNKFYFLKASRSMNFSFFLFLKIFDIKSRSELAF